MEQQIDDEYLRCDHHRGRHCGHELGLPFVPARLAARGAGTQVCGGGREVKQALRKTLLKYQLHREQELFDRAFEYIRQYY